jgi:hypothetical protein
MDPTPFSRRPKLLALRAASLAARRVTRAFERAAVHRFLKEWGTAPARVDFSPAPLKSLI